MRLSGQVTVHMFVKVCAPPNVGSKNQSNSGFACVGLPCSQLSGVELGETPITGGLGRLRTPQGGASEALQYLVLLQTPLAACRPPIAQRRSSRHQANGEPCVTCRLTSLQTVFARAQTIFGPKIKQETGPPNWLPKLGRLIHSYLRNPVLRLFSGAKIGFKNFEAFRGLARPACL